MNDALTLTQNGSTFSAIATLSLIAILVLATLVRATRSLHSLGTAGPLSLSLAISLLALVARIVQGNSLVNDEIVWHHLGVQAGAYLTGSDETAPSYVEGKEGYIWIVGFLYSAGGPAPLLPIFLNIVLQVLLCAIVMRLTYMLAKEATELSRTDCASAARLAGYAVALTPTVQLWVPRILRETLCVTLILLSALFLAKCLIDRRFSYLWGSVAAALGLMWIRDAVGFAVLFAIAATLLLSSAGSGRLRAVKLLGLSGFSLVIFPWMWRLLSLRFGLDSENVAFKYRGLSEASSAFAGASEITDSAGLLGVLRINVLRVLAGPFPWEINMSGVMLLAVVDGLVWLFALYLFMRARPIRRSMVEVSGRERGRYLWLALTILMIVLVIMLSMRVANYGILARMRMMPYLVIMPMATTSWTMLRSQLNRPKRVDAEAAVSDL